MLLGITVDVAIEYCCIDANGHDIMVNIVINKSDK